MCPYYSVILASLPDRFIISSPLSLIFSIFQSRFGSWGLVFPNSPFLFVTDIAIVTSVPEVPCCL